MKELTWTRDLDIKAKKLVGDGQGSLVCCSPWGRKGFDTPEWLNWTEKLIEKT